MGVFIAHYSGHLYYIGKKKVHILFKTSDFSGQMAEG